jgi:hypothetical protein
VRLRECGYASVATRVWLRATGVTPASLCASERMRESERQEGRERGARGGEDVTRGLSVCGRAEGQLNDLENAAELSEAWCVPPLSPLSLSLSLSLSQHNLYATSLYLRY